MAKKKFVIKKDICGGKKLRRQYGTGVGRVVRAGTIVELDASQQNALAPWIELYKEPKKAEKKK